jgi:MFS family permease
MKRSPLRDSLRACTYDGTAHAAMIGFGETYFPAFALALGASPLQVGLLASLPILVGAVFQTFTPRLAARTGNKRWVVVSAALQSLTFIPIALSAGRAEVGFWHLLGWVCLYWALALGLSPPWNVWMGRMIPALVRSRYFGRRNVPIQIMLFVSLVGGGLFLHWVERRRQEAVLGFVILFALAAVSRMVSTWYLSRQHEPRSGEVKPTPLSRVVRGMPHQAYGRVIRLIVAMHACVHISAAYFTPFMLQELDLSYGEFTVLNAATLVTRVLASSYWAEIARAFGNRRALQVAAVMLVPLAGMWVISSNFTYLLALQLFAGFAWSGFELMTVLSLFDTTDERSRARVLSIFNLLNGLAIVCASLVGGAVLRHFGPPGYMAIFLASSFSRLVVVLLFNSGAGHRRPGEHTFQNVFLRVIGFRPGEGPELRPVVMDEAEPPSARSGASSNRRGRGAS